MSYAQDPKQQQRLWVFQHNPSNLKFRNSADYAEQKTLSGDVPDQQFFSTSGKTLQISNILLDSYCLGKSLQPLLDGIEALLKARVSKQIYSPPVLIFVFGTKRYGPCILTEVEWNESAWLSGEAAKAEMSMSFKQVPIARKTADTAIAPKDKKDGSPRSKLTDRQRAEGSSKAIAQMLKSAEKLPVNVQGALRAKAYKVSTNATTGDVTLFDNKGAKLGTIGRYNGSKIDDSESFFTLDRTGKRAKELGNF